MKVMSADPDWYVSLSKVTGDIAVRVRLAEGYLGGFPDRVSRTLGSFGSFSAVLLDAPRSASGPVAPVGRPA